MREFSKDEMDIAAGGIEIYRGFSYGTVPVVSGYATPRRTTKKLR